METVTEKRIHKHCSKCGHNVFISHDGTTYRCEKCHPDNQGGPRIIKTGELNPNQQADTILARARNRGGSGAGDVQLIERMLHLRRAELTDDRIEGLKQALKIAEEEDRKARAGI